ncbi:MAG: M20/M25/M40 family metallo-hydrolase [Kiritimatiellae bacterium]|nr:M20/M25/M40 family metallo-hydrolase [Kiritimatiellia bacterium]
MPCKRPRTPSKAPKPASPAGIDPFSAENCQVFGKNDAFPPETAKILSIFAAISTIPRPSKKEGAVREAIAAWAEARGWKTAVDAAGGSLRIDCPATRGFAKASRVILQAHLDMVLAGNLDAHTPPELLLSPDGKTLRARGTSLGSDDGIGLALALHAMASAAPHGPLRAVFTTDEESGMSGARALPAEWLADARYLFNIDWEEAGEACVSSAGARTLVLSRRGETAPVAAEPARLSVSGLPGGHSGADIDRGIPNALLALGGAIGAKRAPRLVSFAGGRAPNAIPADAEAGLVRPRKGAPLVPAFTQEETRNFLALLRELPNGVLARDGDGKVEDSSSLGIASADAKTARMRLTLHIRSHTEEGMERVRRAVAACAARHGFQTKAGEATAPWRVPETAGVRALAAKAAEGVFGAPFRFTKAHVGLECGIFAEKAPRLEILSFGPTLRFPHSTRETLAVDTVGPTARFLARLLAETAREGSPRARP